jgi:hypothetical protein
MSSLCSKPRKHLDILAGCILEVDGGLVQYEGCTVEAQQRSDILFYFSNGTCAGAFIKERSTVQLESTDTWYDFRNNALEGDARCVFTGSPTLQ